MPSAYALTIPGNKAYDFITADEFHRIVQTVFARMSAQSPIIAQMAEIQRRYDGNTLVVPLPSVEGSPALPKAAPLLIANAIDDVALGAASVHPVISVPAMDPNKATGVRSVEHARTQRRALQATARESHFNLLLRRATRQLTGYASFAMVVVPTEYGPCFELRDPLTAYPDTRAPEDPRPPIDVAFVYAKSASWVRANFPNTRKEEGGPIPPAAGQMDMQQAWNLFEWIDGEKLVIGLLGPTHMTMEQVVSWQPNQQVWMPLVARPNPLGFVPAVIPRRVSMSGIASQISQLTGLVDLMDKLMALDIVAQEKAIFPDRYLIAQEGRTPRIEGGKWKDGRTGETNLLVDVDKIGELHSSPDPRTPQMYDRLFQTFHRSVGVMPQQRGEVTGNLRTGRAIDTMHSIAIDPRIQEIHEIVEASMSHLFMCASKMYRKMYANRPFELLAGRQSDLAVVEFTPAKHFDTDHVAVTYPIPGATVDQLTVALGMMVQAELISDETARRLHPWVEDAEAESFEVVGQAIDKAMLAGVLQAVANTQGPGMSASLLHAARIKRHVKEGLPIDQAIERAWAEVQEEQNQQLNPETETLEPLTAPPELMPGLAGMPGPGGGVVPPVPPGPTPLPPPEQGMPQLLAALGQTPGAL